ncbi:MAG: GGDEF domain-containing protein [Syntrophobacteraceae bacterium]
MLNVNEEDLDKITEAISAILKGRMPNLIQLENDYPENEVKQLTHFVNRFTAEYSAFSMVLLALSRGDLDAPFPPGRMLVLDSLKNLHANLRHLTWKTQQVAKGDLSQRVDFIGDFSASFNAMVEQLAASREELLRKNQELEKTSVTDPLTGLLNRRGVGDLLRRESHRTDRSQRPFSIMIADIDHFKRVNDTWGHDAGDAVLVEISKVFLNHIRKEDVCARWGGEEFLILLTDSELPRATVAVQRLQREVSALRVNHNGLSIGVSISGGISAYCVGESIDACIKRCDLCLYKAKESGRNQVWLQESPEAPLELVPSAPSHMISSHGVPCGELT